MVKFGHVNLVARDWKNLSEFYIRVFGCKPLPPERDLAGAWLEKATGVAGARIQGLHLSLPGYTAGGPTLEIFQYMDQVKASENSVNQAGFAHIAFQVDNVRNYLGLIIANGGSALGEVTTRMIAGAGKITFVYAKDPEGNIIELQTWHP